MQAVLKSIVESGSYTTKEVLEKLDDAGFRPSAAHLADALRRLGYAQFVPSHGGENRWGPMPVWAMGVIKTSEKAEFLRNVAALGGEGSEALGEWFEMQDEPEYREIIRDGTNVMVEFLSLPQTDREVVAHASSVMTDLMRLMAARAHDNEVRVVMRKMLDLMDRFEAQYRGE